MEITNNYFIDSNSAEYEDFIISCLLLDFINLNNYMCIERSSPVYKEVLTSIKDAHSKIVITDGLENYGDSYVSFITNNTNGRDTIIYTFHNKTYDYNFMTRLYTELCNYAINCEDEKARDIIVDRIYMLNCFRQTFRNSLMT